MLILLGKTASGKSTILDALVKRGYKPIITYTSRPQRKGEPKESYHFISEKEFLKKIEDGFFAEWNTYNTTQGKWYYGSARRDYINADEKTVVILNPEGFYSMRNMLDIPYTAIYLYANNSSIQSRLEKRGDDKLEARRRIITDNKDFKGLVLEVDKIVYNNDDDDVKDVVEKIMRFDNA